MDEAFIGTQFKNYRIIRSLGQGGNARVYLGEHLLVQRRAAIKVLTTALTRQGKERFLFEARTLASLAHPHIVGLFDFDFTQRFAIKQRSDVMRDIPFLVMEYAPGGSLKEHYPRGKQVPLIEVVQVIRQVADALQFAHDRNIMHRDVKPANILLNARAEVLLSDFGLAMFERSSESLLVGNEGTPYYMAPEQWLGKPCYASDQYALGVITYEWLHGYHPFEGNRLRVAMAHMSDMPRSLREIRPDVPQEVEVVVARAMAKDPGKRYGSVREFANALKFASRQEVRSDETDLNATVRAFFPVTLPSLPVPVVKDKDASAKASLQVSRKIAALAPVGHRERVGAGSLEVMGGGSSGSSGSSASGGRGRISGTYNKNRARMLKKVRTFWIKGVLEQSLRESAYLHLEMDEQQEMVENAWPLELYQRDQSADHVPLTQGITSVYDRVDGELMILGEAGSGKTTLLLELARDLLKRAEGDESQEIPVVFLLSSWVEKRLPIEQWMVEELNSKYQVPRVLGKRWVTEDQIIPLLDGLDEVPEQARTACIRAINRYRQEHGLRPMVVCSRTKDYVLQSPRVSLGSAVIIKPLTMQQIEPRLVLAGKRYERVLRLLRSDLVVQEMVTTPLMLNIVTVASQGLSIEQLHLAHSSQERYRQLFATYTEQVLRRRQPMKGYGYGMSETMEWLAHVAGQMKRRNQTMYYIEQLQPDLIEEKWHKRMYELLGVWLPFVLLGALLALLIMDLLPYNGGNGHKIATIILGDGLVGALTAGVLYAASKKAEVPSFVPKRWRNGWKRWRVEYFGVGIGLSLMFKWAVNGTMKYFKPGLGHLMLKDLLPYGIASLLLMCFLTRPKQGGARFLFMDRRMIEKWLGPNSLDVLVNGMVVGLVFTLATSSYDIIVQQLLVFEAMLKHVVYHVPKNKGIFDYLGIVLRDGLRYGIVGILLSFILRKDDGMVRPMEVVMWSWKNVWRALRNVIHKRSGLVIALGVGFSYCLSYSNRGPQEAIISGLVIGLITAAIYYCVMALFMGVSGENLRDRDRSRPNEGIKRSLYASVIVGVVGIVAWGVLFSLANIVKEGAKDGARSLFGHSFKFVSFLGQVDKGFATGFAVGRQNWLLYGLIGGLVVWLLVGGQAVIRHVLVRILLWWEGKLPWNVARFLNYGRDVVLVRKVGGGYMFVHRLLQEYFVSIEQGLGRRKEIIDAKTMPPIDVLNIPGGDDRRDSSGDLLERTIV